MKMTGKTLTLRGTMDSASMNGDFIVENILDYANVLDISKAWRLRWFEVWPFRLVGTPGFAKDAISIETVLLTDSVGPPDYNRADDNRQIAWGNQSYYGGHQTTSTSSGFVAGQNIVDPDHIIQKRLDIAFRSLCSSASENSAIDINYIVYLEEVEITANESIISTIKGSGQNIEA